MGYEQGECGLLVGCIFVQVPPSCAYCVEFATSSKHLGLMWSFERQLYRNADVGWFSDLFPFSHLRICFLQQATAAALAGIAHGSSYSHAGLLRWCPCPGCTRTGPGKFPSQGPCSFCCRYLIKRDNVGLDARDRLRTSRGDRWMHCQLLVCTFVVKSYLLASSKNRF